MAYGAASRAARDSLDLPDEPGSTLRKPGVGPGFRLHLRRFRIPLGLTAWASLRSAPPYINEGSGTPANAGHQPPHQATRRALNGARTLAGVPPRLSPKGIIPSQRLSFRPGFLGLGLHGRYPPSPVPVQGCTSHPGRNAGRHDAQAAREQTANPPAGTALAPMTRCASAPCPSPERGLRCNCIRDDCQEPVPENDTDHSPRPIHRHPEVAAKRPSKDAAEALGPPPFEARYARTSG